MLKNEQIKRKPNLLYSTRWECKGCTMMEVVLLLSTLSSSPIVPQFSKEVLEDMDRLLVTTFSTCGGLGDRARRHTPGRWRKG